MSTSRTAGSATAPMRRRHGEPRVAPAGIVAGGRPALVPALQRGRGRAEHHLGAFALAAPYRQVARRVARAFLLLVARVVLLVDHDQPQRRHRREHRHARAQHDARRAAVRRQPAGQALRIRHAAVQRDHGAAAEARLEARFELRREVDLRHHHQRLRGRLARQQRRHGLQIDLGLAAAGAAEQQEGAAFLPRSAPARSPARRRAPGRSRPRRRQAHGAGTACRLSRRASCTALRSRNWGGRAASAISPSERW